MPVGRHSSGEHGPPLRGHGLGENRREACKCCRFPDCSSNVLLLASHKGCFVEGPLFQSASYDCRAADFMFSFKIGHVFVCFRGGQTLPVARRHICPLCLFFLQCMVLMGMQRVLSHKAIKSSDRAECSLEPHNAVAHTQTQQTK